MKGLTSNQCNYLIWLGLIGFTTTIHMVDGSCSKSSKKLWAYTKPNTETFTDTYKGFITSDRGEHCKWIITTSDEDTYIKLTFSNFQLKNSTKSDKGDCLEIYDGDDGKKLDELCDKAPKEFYKSTESEIRVIYTRGEVEGVRQFSMTYSSHSAMSKEYLIKIAGIVGAVIAGLGLAYFLLRFTKCCKCLRKKISLGNNNPTDGATREQDRLVQNAEQGRMNGESTQNGTTVQPQSQPAVQLSNNGATFSAGHQSGETVNRNENDNAHDSDTDSLQEMNELPPSYESLYLNEMGEPVTPPKYSPPEHRRHPPRRVNTVN